MELASENLDQSYDQQLECLTELTWLPWIGSGYENQNSKVMILGESVYDWDPKERDNIIKIYKRDSLRRRHINHAFNFQRSSKFVRNIERAIFNKKHPTNIEKHSLWVNSIYHNLVLRVMKSKKHRPSINDYKKGWSVTLMLFSILEVRQVIVYGLEQKKLQALREQCLYLGWDFDIQKIKIKVGRTLPRVATIGKGSCKVKLLFVKHPSAFFSWKRWSPIISGQLSITQ